MSLMSLKRGAGPAVLVLALALLTSATDGGASAVEPVRLLAVNFPPYEIEDPEAGQKGFDVEVVEAAFKAVDMSATVDFLPWARILKMVEGGLIAGMLTCADSPTRRKFSWLSDPISQATSAFLVRGDYHGKPLSRLSDLQGANFVAVRGYVYVNDLHALGIFPLQVSSDQQALRMLAKKRADVIVVGLEYARYLIKKLNIELDFQHFEIADQPIAQLHLCLSKAYSGSESLRDRFNQGLAAIRANGVYDAIHAKY